MSRMITYNQRLPESLLQRIDQELEHEQLQTPGLTRSELVRRMLEESLKNRQACRALAAKKAKHDASYVAAMLAPHEGQQ